MTTATLKSSTTDVHNASDHVDDSGHPPVHYFIPKSSLAELRCYSFRLGLAVREWDGDSAWRTLSLMAPLAALEASEHPFKKPNMGLIAFLFGFLAKAIETADLHRVRNTLSEMLRAAYLA